MSHEAEYETVRLPSPTPEWAIKGPGIVGTCGRWDEESDAKAFSEMLNKLVRDLIYSSVGNALGIRYDSIDEYIKSRTKP